MRGGAYLWDNLWYGGHYPLASYSLLYYFPAAVVGNLALVIAATAVSAALFASVSARAWGVLATWPARAFAVLGAMAPLVTGTYPFALGLTALLASLRALQSNRVVVALACAALALGFSPLAFVFLVLALLAALGARPRLDGRAVRVGLAIGALVAIELAIAATFPATGDPPFTVDAFAGVLALCAFAALLAVRAPQGRTLAAFFLLWAAASVVAFALPTPIGSNLARLRLVAFPLVLLAACLARFRPPLLALGAIVLALLATVAPYRTQIPSIVNGRTDEAAFWVSPLAFLRAHADPNYRVEVIPTGGHWEAFYLPRAGFPLARGWYRQLDMSENPLLYRKRLNPAAYRGWLRRMGVRFVLRAHAGLDGNGTATEAALVDSGRSGLVQVFGDRSWSIYELPKATPLLTPAGAARLTHVGRELVTGWARKRGSYRLRIHYTPDWQVEQGAVCTLRAADGMTVLRVE